MSSTRPIPTDKQPSRQRLVRTVAAVLGVLVLGAAGFIVWNRYFEEASPADPGTSCPQVVAPTAHPPLASVGIRRVALVGDSIMYQASCSVAGSLAQVGIQTSRYAVPGTGLLSGSVDWVRTMQLIMAMQHPDAVIGVFVGNYFPTLGTNAFYEAVPDNTPAFYAAWRQRAVELSDVVRAAGAQMYWVSPPPIQSPLLDHAQQVFAGYETIPGDHTIDAGAVLAGSGGSEVPNKSTCGRIEVVRTADAIHLTDDGARIYGQEIAHLFTAQTGVVTSPKPC